MHNTTGHQNSAHKHSSMPGSHAVLHDQEFAQFRDMIYRIAGISMSAAKKQLVSSRLAKRLRHHNFSSYGEYFRFITSVHGKAELQVAVDALTTNETHFFREPKHFDFLRNRVIPSRKIGSGVRNGAQPVPAGKSLTASR